MNIYLSAAQTLKHPIISSAARSSVSPAFPCPDFDSSSSAYACTDKVYNVQRRRYTVFAKIRLSCNLYIIPLYIIYFSPSV